MIPGSLGTKWPLAAALWLTLAACGEDDAVGEGGLTATPGGGLNGALSGTATPPATTGGGNTTGSLTGGTNLDPDTDGGEPIGAADASQDASDGGTSSVGGDDAAPAEDAGEPEAGPGEPPERGRLTGITEAHNVVRRMVDADPPLPELTWNTEAAAYAQQWADTLAADCSFEHSEDSPYGENLAYQGPAGSSTAQDAVQGWASEVACWTYGSIAGTEQCDMGCTAALNSNGCGHYTQIVWRDTTSVGCGVASCKSGSSADIWVCSYAPRGNIVWENPF